jgi:methylenetetrahydrofolate dehydrogenase (NADP+)/methenyltetrahydrofolate cyclohydrolase
MTLQQIDGKKIAKSIKDHVEKDIADIRKHTGIIPTIVTIMVGENPESSLYLRLRDAACEKVGITSKHIMLKESISEKDLLQIIQELNNDNTIHGILVQLPLPTHLSAQHIFATIAPEKDVEGFHPYNLGHLVDGKEQIIPCTPQAVLEIIKYVNMDLKGKHVVIVNHSTVVGKPLALLCLTRNATVSVCHVYTHSLPTYTNSADILISAAGVPNLITKDHVKDDFFVIDVGIIQTDHGIQGDIDVESIKEKSGMITPVPGGVGPVTVACSLKNMVKTIRNCLKE